MLFMNIVKSSKGKHKYAKFNNVYKRSTVIKFGLFQKCKFGLILDNPLRFSIAEKEIKVMTVKREEIKLLFLDDVIFYVENPKNLQITS